MKKILSFLFVSTLTLSACASRPTQIAEHTVTKEPSTQTPLPTQQPTSTLEPSPTPIPVISINPENAGSVVAFETITEHGLSSSIFIPNTSSIITMGNPGKPNREIRIWERDISFSQRLTNITAFPLAPYGISPNGELIAITFLPEGAETTEIGIFELETGSFITKFEYQNTSLSFGVTEIIWSPNGELIATGNANGQVQAYETKTYSRVFDIKIQTGQKDSVAKINSIDFSPDGKILAAAGQDEVIRMWDTSNWNEVDVIKNSDTPILSIDFSPNGKFIAVGESDEFYIWDLENKKEVEGFNPQYKTFAVAYSPHGDLIATGGIDRHLRIWRTDTWEFVADLQEHKSKITNIEFSPDAQFIVSSSEFVFNEVPLTIIIWGLP
jgi:WD40 repeat protein